MDNQKLSARVEALEGPCRECDCLIENTLGLAKFERDPRVIYGDAYYNRVEPKPYTASLDAAMLLVPEGWSWGVTAETERKERKYSASVRRYWTSFDKDYFCFATTPALALCAAALKARGL